MRSSAHNLTQIQRQPSVLLWLPSSRLAFILQESMPSSITRDRPKSIYYHNGIGGRGNYHKRAEEDPSFRQSRAHFARSLAAYLCRGCSGHASKQHEFEEAGDSSIRKGRGFRILSKWFTGIGALWRSQADSIHQVATFLLPRLRHQITPPKHSLSVQPTSLEGSSFSWVNGQL